LAQVLGSEQSPRLNLWSDRGSFTGIFIVGLISVEPLKIQEAIDTLDWAMEVLFVVSESGD